MPGAAEWVSQAEKRLDDALDSVLSVQMEDSGAEAQNDNMSLMDSDAHTTDDNGPLNFCKVNLSLPTLFRKNTLNLRGLLGQRVK